MPLYHIIYMSSAVAEFSPADLQDLLSKSRINNGAQDVTGLLLYKDGSFLQLIEGEEEVINRLYQKISRDPRHTGIITFVHEEIESREFENWSMAFRDLDSSMETFPEGYNELLNTTWSKELLEAFTPKLRAFMGMFVR